VSQPNDFGAVADAISGAIADPKPWWESRRQWGLLIWCVGWLLGRVGVDVDTATLTAFVPQLIEIIGVVIGVWGAIRAERPIDVARVLPGVSIPGVRNQRVQANRPDPFGSFGGSD
jgi:hypothetical protein